MVRNSNTTENGNSFLILSPQSELRGPVSWHPPKAVCQLAPGGSKGNDPSHPIDENMEF